MTVYGVEYLKNKLEQKRLRVLMRYSFYEMKNSTFDFGISTPPDLRRWNSCVGWCAKAVDSLADRLVFREFRDDNFNMNGIFNMNNPDVIFSSAVLSALISSCCFLYISQDESLFPRIQVIDGANATGTIDQITGMLTEGYAVLERDQYERPLVEAYFTDRETVFRNEDGSETHFRHNAGYPLLVPVIFRPDARRPFGHSRISRSCMSITGSALRTIKRGEISAEFFSYPQKYVTGLSEDAEISDRWKAAMSAMMSFTKDENNDHPIVGQFQQQSMEPHNAQLRMFASIFAGETGLTLDDLGFPSENPSSAEAIKASHESMRLTAAAAQKSFGSGFLNAGFIAACLRDDYPYKRRQVYLTKPVWEPIFTPDASMLSLIGDGAIKINQAVPGFFSDQTLHDLTGIAGKG